jgi:hypothetical protein
MVGVQPQSIYLQKYLPFYNLMSFLIRSIQKRVLASISIIFSSLLLLSSTFLFHPLSGIDAQPALSGESINLSNSTGNSYLPKIAVHFHSGDKNQSYKDSIYVIWTDNTTGNGDIYFKRSADNGTSFGNVENLSNSTGNSTDAQIAVNQNNVYVIWTDNTTGNGDIYFKRSADNGTSFGNVENLSNSTGNSYEPQIVISGNNVYVVWTDNTTGNGDIYFKRSADNGTSFGSTQNLGTNQGESSAAQLAVYQDNVYVVWSDDTTGNGDIYFKASLDNGTKFGGRKVLAKNNGSSFEPQIAVSPNNIVYAAWQDDTPYVRQQENDTSVNVLFRVSNNSGSVFANRNTIGGDVGDSSNFTNIATVPGEPYLGMINDAYVVWSDILKYRQPGTFEVFFQKITNNGTALSDPVNLSNNDGDSIMPDIAVSYSGTVYVAWSDDSTGISDVYFMRVI